MAIQAAPPWIGPGQSTTLRALTYVPDQEPMSLSWSWCPLTNGAQGGYACVVEPMAGVDFDLGGGAEAVLSYPATSEVITGICATIYESELAAFVELPDCSVGLPVTIKLEATWRGETQVAVKEVRLLFDANAAHQNPSLAGVSFAVEPESGEAEPDEAAPLEDDEVYDAGQTYRLFLDVPQESAESFVPAPTEVDPDPDEAREALVFTWFVTLGETGALRTAWAEPELSLDSARTNTWILPDREDSDATAATLYLVVRDGRGGTGWIRRAVNVSR